MRCLEILEGDECMLHVEETYIIEGESGQLTQLQCPLFLGINSTNRSICGLDLLTCFLQREYDKSDGMPRLPSCSVLFILSLALLGSVTLTKAASM